MSIVDEIQRSKCTVSELRSFWSSTTLADDRKVSRSLALALVINPQLEINQIRELLPWFEDSKHCVDVYIEHRLNSGEDRTSVDDLVAEFPQWAERIRASEELTDLLAALEMPHGDSPAQRVETGPDRSERYQLVRLMGRGSQGEVHEAIDHDHPGNRVAIKLFRSADTRLRELLGARLVDHRNVARLVDHGAYQGRAFVAYRIVDGTTLADYADNRVLSWREATELICAIGDGLVAVHAAGLVHRDIKPRNIMIDRDGTPILVDFGIAMDSELAQNAGMEGSLPFMAPEQFNGSGSIPVSDVYSLAGVLYWLLSGVQPNGRGSTIARSALTSMQRPSMDHIPADVPERLVGVIRNALDPRAGTRTDSASRLVSELQAVLDDRPIHGVDGVRSAASLFFRRQKAAIPLAVVLGLAVIGGIAYVARAPVVSKNQRLSDQLSTMHEHTEKARDLMEQVMIGFSLTSDISDAQGIFLAFQFNRADEMTNGLLGVPNADERYQAVIDSIGTHIDDDSSNLLKGIAQELAGIAAEGCGKHTIAGGHYNAADKYFAEDLGADHPFIAELRAMREK